MIFIDIETNGLFKNYSELSEVSPFCIVCVEESGKVYSFDPPRLREFVYYAHANKDETFVGHNIIGFDSLVLEKCMGVVLPNMVDTLLLTQLMYPDMFKYDETHNLRVLPKKLWGLHSLEAWGKRIGHAKMEAPKFDTYSEQMMEYCINDTILVSKLYNYLSSRDSRGLPPESVLKLEQEFYKYTMKQQLEGVPYDASKALDLIKLLDQDFNEILEWAKTELPYEEIAYKKLKKPPKIIYFNPTSRDQIGNYFMDKYKWNPLTLTPKSGKPKISEEILETLPYEEAKKFTRAFQIKKIKGFLSSGDNSWSRHYCNYTGRIHGAMSTLGTSTGRAAHHSPNLGQVPSVRAYMGREVRSLFHAGDPDYTLVGFDASSLELRCLAHYLFNYDDGEYADIVLNGDVHTYNQKAAGLATRDQAKTFIYAMIYGAGNKKLGSIVDPTADEYKQETLGRSAKDQFLRKIKGYEQLSKDLKNALFFKGHIKAIDGRKIYVDKIHTALNYLLQSCGAIIMKQATVLFYERTKALCSPCLHIHDEIQVICRKEDAEIVGQAGVKAIQDTKDILKFKLKLDGEYKAGYSWDRTH